ncbi:aspartate aminotransferase [Arenibacter algicola]|uniref:Aminotransferase n=1 Tax=Arenibacter algicola TaxID=616991 RepID=A0ABY3AD03_9FLAO|nr:MULTISPECIES: pyridoxal phosphate-dependent aminotransferase [Arenibacter]MBD3661327.1 pyridoxal phosphate-dependent aminotransferase [Arenibacter algicola]MDX1758036.1 pyridoxal phosphate-dependent aminotransferase [Arenibacter algicola]GBF20898.1 aspartate aminotransferase [Arenibacter sp. NBRC 103722]
MKNHLSDRINSMSTSATLAMAAKARELKNEGKDIIGLSLGEPDFNIPDFIKEAAKEAIDQNYSSYSPVDGYADLKQAIANKFKRDNGLTYGLNQIVVSTGAKQSLANIAMVMLNDGDEVILPAPYWVSYSDIVKLAQGVPVEVPTSIDTDFKMTPEQLEKAITPKTKMMWFSSPCNPSGSVYNQEELEGLAKVLRKHPNIFVVSDEIYEHINFRGGHVSIANIEGMYDRTITVNGVSKAFAMTGWRIGYIGGPDWIAKACTKFQGQITSGANSIAQRATIAALNAPISSIKFMIDEFHKRRDLVLELLGEIKGFNLNVPEGAFYVFPDISSFFGKTINGTLINNASDFALYLLEKANVATVTGEAFGNDNCIRISYAASEKELREAMARIKAVL